jgi:transcriptional regulator GlxA family with amidase domain
LKDVQRARRRPADSPPAKGHWPKGKPRNAPIPAPRLRQVQRWFERHRGYAGPTSNERSVKRVALAIGVSDRTLRRWLTREDHPSPDRWRALIAYVAELGF